MRKGAGRAGKYRTPKTRLNSPMQHKAAAVEPNGRDTMNFTPIEPGDSMAELPERPAGKFVYPGGSRPLEGYTIKRAIGQGGFGEIYYATSDAGKEVALKLIRRNLDVELRGIRHCLNLKHPNLLALYDIRQDNEGDTWVVMEYASGGCLQDAVADNPRGLPVDKALAWFHGIAAGVAYLHDRGIVHRDLKPGNVFSDEGFVKVGDYGLSKFISCSRRSGQTESVGTVHYMAPEVANGRYGKEIDIYAMGVMLYEILTGRVPFDGESVGEVLMKHLTATADLSALAEPYRGVVGRALEKDPQKRFRSIAEMAAALPSATQGAAGPGMMPPGKFTAASAAAIGGNPPPGQEQEVVEARVVDEEPILRMVQDSFEKLRAAWDEANLTTPVKVALLVLGLFVLLAGSGTLIPLAVMLLVVYGGYRLVRMLVLSGQSPGGAAARPMVVQPPPVAPKAAAPPPGSPPGHRGVAQAQARPGHGQRHPRHRHRRHPREEAAMALVLKPRRERFAELVGSLLIGSLSALVMCVVVVLLISYHGAVPRPEQCAWLALMSIAGTWAVLIPSKFWEGTLGETALRRFVMMLIGLGLGAMAFGVASTLMVDLPYTRDFPEPSNYQLPDSFYLQGRPLAMAYMACFGTLFLLMRWWRQADPLRVSRLSIWPLVVSTAMAGVVAAAWHFPQPWLPMVAVCVAVSVQLASPWVHPSKRSRPRKS